MTPAEIDALIARLRKLATKATEGPWFVGYDEAHDTIPHRDSGLSLVDTGRQSDWPIARLCESGNANFIAACDPQTILHLLDALDALKADAVPCEPTKAMIEAGIHAMAWDESETEAATKWVRAFWQAMYDAARAEKPD